MFVRLGSARQLLADRKIPASLTREAGHWQAGPATTRLYGARPLERGIQRELQSPLALEILEGRIRDGARLAVEVEVDESGLRINGAAVPRAPETKPASSKLATPII